MTARDLPPLGGPGGDGTGPVGGPGGVTGRGIFSPELLDTCISCGFCLPACPTYDLTGDEASSPRGRITLMRALETGELPENDPVLIEQASQCLGCRACEPVCPAGVQYGALLEEWRDHQWSGTRMPFLARALTQLMARRWVVRLMGLPRRHAGRRDRRRTRRGGRDRCPTGPTAPSSSGETSLVLGCAERALFPAVSRAAQALRPELDAPENQGCCGALHAHNGELDQGRQMARELGDRLPGTLVTTSGGCAAHLSSVLGRDRVQELSEYLTHAAETHTVGPGAADRPGELRVNGRRARVGLQDSCHLRNGMGVFREPRALIAGVADLVELRTASTCCGAAGTYSLLRPRESRAVLDPTLDEIEAADLDVLAVVNPGCQRQLIAGLRRRRSQVQVLHLAELLARAR